MQRIGRRGIPLALAFVAALLLIVSGAAAKKYEIGAYDVRLQLTDSGDYVITERITYDFLEGSFTTGNRDVPVTGFHSLRFLSLEPVDVPIESVSYRDGRRLVVDWTYPETADTATFILTYEAAGGLRSEKGFNVIDWNPVGSGWTVPVRNVSVTVQLPPFVDPARVEALPAGDLAGPPRSDGLRFQRPSVPPRTFYHVIVRFPEVWVVEPPPSNAPWVLLGLGVGLLLAVGELLLYYRDRPRGATSGPDPESLSLLQLGGVLFRTELERRRSIAATVFHLAQRGRIRLVVAPKTNVFGTDEVKVEVGETVDLGPAEARLVDGLGRAGTLRRFARDSGTIRDVLKLVDEQLEEKGLRPGGLQRQSALVVAGAFSYAILAIAAIAFSQIQGAPVALALGIVFLLQFIGKIVRVATMVPLTPEGLFVKGEAKKLLDEKLRRVDDHMRYETERAWDALFDELPWLAMHSSVTGTKLSRWQRQFRRLEHVRAPEWFDWEPGKAGTVLDGLTAAQQVNYVFLAIMSTPGSTGGGASGTAGVGAAGSGAGGGGGGAG